MKLNFENKRGDNGVPSYGVKNFTPVETKLSFWKKKRRQQCSHPWCEPFQTCENEAQLPEGKNRGQQRLPLKEWILSHMWKWGSASERQKKGDNSVPTQGVKNITPTYWVHLTPMDHVYTCRAPPVPRWVCRVHFEFLSLTLNQFSLPIALKFLLHCPILWDKVKSYPK